MSNPETGAISRSTYLNPEELIFNNSECKDAVEDNFDKLSRFSINQARSMGVPEDCLDDVAQESLLAVWLKTQQGVEFDSAGKLISYVSVATRRKAVDFNRSEKPAAELPIFFGSATNPEEEAIARVELECVINAACNLSETKRSAISKSVYGEAFLNQAERAALSRGRRELKLLIDAA